MNQVRAIVDRLARRAVAGIAVSLLALAAAGAGRAADGRLPGELVDQSRLRVCADPSNLPFSNEAGEGFENRIAALFAEELGRELVYTWYPSTVGFVRNTLAARRCDLVMGVPATSELMQNTNPYYRSTHVLVQRADAAKTIKSLDDPALKEMKIGGVANTPPITILAQQGLINRLVPYQLVVDTRHDHPAEQMVADVAAGKIDIAVVWGPIGGYYASRHEMPLTVTPMLGEEGSPVRLDFLISMGLRRGEPDWKDRLNDLLRENAEAIEAILFDYGVPLLDRQGRLIEPPAADGQQQGGLVLEPDGYRMADYRAPVPDTLAGGTVLTTEALQGLIETGAPLLIDVMPAARKPAKTTLWLAPTRANLPGSHWLANTGLGDLAPEFEAYFEAQLAALTAGDRARPLVFYCEADCWMSWNAAKRALALGYRKVAWYPDGTTGWAAAGLELVESAPVPMPDFAPRS
jgi:quinoprotein dehydrogenase-associated probable ABC transporter substrate-binding protein/PQQ-dependent catabolism-associated CXXCW motif protein